MGSKPKGPAGVRPSDDGGSPKRRAPRRRSVRTFGTLVLGPYTKDPWGKWTKKDGTVVSSAEVERYKLTKKQEGAYSVRAIRGTTEGPDGAA